MLLVKPSVAICDTIDGMAMLSRIEAAGRTCYKSEDKITEDSCLAFIKMIIARGHETVLEHEKVTVRFICDRGVSHEIVRHRLASYSQESTRYCDYTNGEVVFIIPSWIDDLEDGPAPHAIVGGCSDESLVWLSAMADAESRYHKLRRLGWKPEQARSVLPNSLKTEIVMSANLREWRHFFKLRTAPAAHPQMRELATPLLQEMKALIPVVFDDL